MIKHQGHLEFKKVIESGAPGTELLPNKPSQQLFYGRKQKNAEKPPYLVQKKPLITGELVENAVVRTSESAVHPYSIILKFSDEGAQESADVITSLKPEQEQVAIILDGIVLSAPFISQALWNSAKNSNPVELATIEGDFSLDEAKRLASVLSSDALPAEINISRFSKSRVDELTISLQLENNWSEMRQLIIQGAASYFSAANLATQSFRTFDLNKLRTAEDLIDLGDESWSKAESMAKIAELESKSD